MNHATKLSTWGIALLVVSTACGGSADSRSQGQSITRKESTVNHDRGGSKPSRFERGGSGARSTGTMVVLEVVHTAFRPPELRVEVGRDVTWKQTEAQPHSVTAVDGSFDSHPGCGLLAIRQCMAAGDVFSHSFDEPGTYEYYCRVHGLPDGTGMTGVIAVTG